MLQLEHRTHLNVKAETIKQVLEIKNIEHAGFKHFQKFGWERLSMVILEPLRGAFHTQVTTQNVKLML